MSNGNPALDPSSLCHYKHKFIHVYTYEDDDGSTVVVCGRGKNVRDDYGPYQEFLSKLAEFPHEVAEPEELTFGPEWLGGSVRLVSYRLLLEVSDDRVA